MNETHRNDDAPPPIETIVPAWPVDARVRTLVTTRAGGCSDPPYGQDPARGGGLNLGDHCGDDPVAVAANRRRLVGVLPAAPRWLQQVHGQRVVEFDAVTSTAPEVADAAITSTPGVVLAVLSADCLPVLLAAGDGSVVGIAHAGWRGLAAGVVGNTLAAMRKRRPDAEIHAWLGPAIGPQAFEVGADVLAAFGAALPGAGGAFAASPRPGKWFADLYRLARERLQADGVASIGGGGLCTFSDVRRFYSYRRDGRTGRMASLIWIDPPAGG